MAEITTVVLYHYEWQNALEQALAWTKHAGYEADTEIQASGDIVLKLMLPVGDSVEDARRKIHNLLDQSGTTVYFEKAEVGVLEVPPPAIPPKHFPTGTNQTVINLFNTVFGSTVVNGQPAFIDALTRAQLVSIAQSRTSNYSGLPIEDLPGLTTAEKDRLIQAMTRFALPPLP